MKIQVNKQNVGLRIKQLRQDKGYTLEEFGKLLGDYQANKATVLGWENGRSLPNKERIKAIAKLGDMTVNELLYGSVEEFIRENYLLIISKKSSDYILENLPVDRYLKHYKEYILVHGNSLVYPLNISDIDYLLTELRELVYPFLKKEKEYESLLKNTAFNDLKEYTMQTGLGDITKDDTVFKATFNNVFNELSIEEKKEVVKLALELYKDNDNIQTIYIEELEKWLKQDN